MKKRITFLLLAFVAGAAQAQDPHFSQYGNLPLYLNPAHAGNSIEHLRLTAVYRNQWSGLASPYTTQGFFVDKRVSRFGFGMQVVKNGMGKASVQRLDLSGMLAYHLPTGKWSTLSGAMQVGMINKRFNPSDLLFDNQYVDDVGFDPSLSNGEVFTNTSITRPDLTMGIVFQNGFGNPKATFKPFGGVSFAHVNRPGEAFIDGDIRMPVRQTWHAGAGIVLSENIELRPLAVVMLQEHFNEIYAGGTVSFLTKNTNKIQGGVYLRNKDAGIAYVGYQVNQLFIGTSYDFTISSLNTVNKGRGGFELTLSYIPKKRGKGLPKDPEEIIVHKKTTKHKKEAITKLERKEQNMDPAASEVPRQIVFVDRTPQETTTPAEPLALNPPEPPKREMPAAEPVAVPPVTPTETESVVVAEPVTEAVAEPVTEAVAEPVTETVAEPVTETVAEPVTEAVAEPVTETVAEPVTEAVAIPVVEPMTEPVVNPVAETISRTATEEIASSTPPVVTEPEHEKLPDVQAAAMRETPAMTTESATPDRIHQPSDRTVAVLPPPVEPEPEPQAVNEPRETPPQETDVTMQAPPLVAHADPFIDNKPAVKSLIDSDGDGIADSEDDCPYIQGGRNTRGCPDTDDDGIIDMKDHCPMEPGTAANRGCPEHEPAYAQGNLIRNFSNIEFATGRAVVKTADVYDIIEYAIDILYANPESRIVLTGHTDNEGNEVQNMILSARRTAVVKRYLETHGIKPDRIRIVNYGETMPLANNFSAEGRARNRRVEINIVRN